MSLFVCKKSLGEQKTMDIRKIRKLIELINETGIGEIEVTSGEEAVRISRTAPAATHAIPTAAPAPVALAAPAAAAPAAAPAVDNTPDGHAVKSPMVGTAYLSSTPGDPPFVKIGDRVSAGDTLCLIEAMKMFNKIEADKAGVISARLVENEQPVEFDQPLFIIDDSE
jgi:acetyl-CoA carboxylase biotin carboxyl carrier protein